MGHSIACEQYSTPQTIIPSPHVVPISHTKCQPYGIIIQPTMLDLKIVALVFLWLVVRCNFLQEVKPKVLDTSLASLRILSMSANNYDSRKLNYELSPLTSLRHIKKIILEKKKKFYYMLHWLINIDQSKHHDISHGHGSLVLHSTMHSTFISTFDNMSL